MQESITKEEQIGIVLLNMGGPSSLDDIRPFLYELFADPQMIQLPIWLRPFQKPLAYLIAKFRTPSTSDMYEQIGGGSQIVPITKSFGEKLAHSLQEYGIEATSTVAMRYSDPRAEDAIEKLEQENVNKIVVFSQYPHYAEATTQSSLDDFYQALEQSSLADTEIIEIDDWGLEPEYIDWWIQGIDQQLDQIEMVIDEDVHVIFTVHGLPMKYIEKGEKYPQRVEAAVERIKSQLHGYPVTWHLAYQSQAGPFPWLQPYTDDLIDELAEQDPKALVMVPLGFVSNHVETVYEIDILYGDQAKELGIDNYYRVEVPDDDTEYARSMARMIHRRIKEGF